MSYADYDLMNNTVNTFVHVFWCTHGHISLGNIFRSIIAGSSLTTTVLQYSFDSNCPELVQSLDVNFKGMVPIKNATISDVSHKFRVPKSSNISDPLPTSPEGFPQTHAGMKIH